MTNVVRLVDFLRSREKTDGVGVCIYSKHKQNFDSLIMSYESLRYGKVTTHECEGGRGWGRITMRKRSMFEVEKEL